MTEAHRISQGEGVTVAVPDTGVAPHPDIRLNLLPGTSFLPGSPTDGREDPNGHGTAMAGLIGAHGQGPITGALGIAPKAKILPIRTSSPNNEGDADRLALAIEYAVAKGADVVSVSGGGGVSPRLLRALQTARSANVIVVAAAGNKPLDSAVIYPAAASNVVAVGGIDRSGGHAETAITGPQLDVVAPAVDIYSINAGEGYRLSTGTSNSTAIVAGAVALIRAEYPHLSADEIVNRLTATAVDKGPPGRDDQYGYGVIDLVAALTADVPPRGFESVPATSPEGAGPTTAAADGPRDDGDGAATVRGLITLGVLLAAGGAWALFVRHRRRSDDPPPRITR
ncbi:type VII secretion-associated serine protease mycosin [Micromonospora sp. NPDC051296]|uniref:type VII secretion-associated serine protease mycosin n=1 Tax=Micromonospora sp. NPDC051296 TaxID=3155046 RepID=UPI0034258767